MKNLLQEFVGSDIGINVIRAYRIDTAKLVAVHDEYFTVTTDNDDNSYHIPLANIVKVMQNADGVNIGGGLFKQHKSHPLVIKIGHVVEYVPT